MILPARGHGPLQGKMINWDHWPYQMALPDDQVIADDCAIATNLPGTTAMAARIKYAFSRSTSCADDV
jgi:hypothetical protein